MANYVSSSISVWGTQKAIEAFVEKAKQPRPFTWNGEPATSEELVDLSFWNFVSPPEEDYDYYFDRVKEEKPKGYETWSDEKQLAFRMSFSGKDGYAWNIRNWGVGHDLWELDDSGVDITSEHQAHAYYAFQTKWAIPDKVFEAMTEQHPELTFEFESQEETGWGATFSGDKGEFVETDSWSEPSNHAEHEKRDQTCACEWDSDSPEDWYEDCPKTAEEQERWNAKHDPEANQKEEPNLVY
jgi:hypothetical protein